MTTTDNITETLKLLQSSVNLLAGIVERLDERIKTIEWRQEWEINQWRRAWVRGNEGWQPSLDGLDKPSAPSMASSRASAINLSDINVVKEEKDGETDSDTSGEQLSDAVGADRDRSDS